MVIVLLLASAGLLAGCSWLEGAQPPTGGGGGGADPDRPIAGGGGGDVPPAGGGARREEPDPGIVDAQSAEIERFAIGPDGRTLVIFYWGGTPGCFGLREVLLEVQDGTPIVSVLEGMRPEAVGAACTMELVLKSALITLDRPIVIDGSGAAHPPGEPPLDVQPPAVEPEPGIVDARVIPVGGYGLSADGRTLAAIYVGGVEDCYGLAQLTAGSNPDGSLTVTVREGRRPDATAACPDLGVVKAAIVKLDAPLIVQAAFDEGPRDGGATQPEG